MLLEIVNVRALQHVVMCVGVTGICRTGNWRTWNWRIKVTHPNLYAFLGHLQNTTVDNMSDVARIRNGLQIRRPKLEANLVNESRIKACLSRFDNGSYSRLQSCVLSATPSERTPSHYNPIQTMTARTKTRIRSLQAPTTSGSSSAATVASATDDRAPQPWCCEVCLTAPIEGFAMRSRKILRKMCTYRGGHGR